MMNTQPYCQPPAPQQKRKTTQLANQTNNQSVFANWAYLINNKLALVSSRRIFGDGHYVWLLTLR